MFETKLLIYLIICISRILWRILYQDKFSNNNYKTYPEVERWTIDRDVWNTNSKQNRCRVDRISKSPTYLEYLREPSNKSHHHFSYLKPRTDGSKGGTDGETGDSLEVVCLPSEDIDKGTDILLSSGPRQHCKCTLVSTFRGSYFRPFTLTEWFTLKDNHS